MSLSTTVLPRFDSPPTWAEAASIVAKHSDNPSAFLALNAETRHFRVPDIDGMIAYRPAGRRYLVQVGGVFAPAPDRARLLAAFVAYARTYGRQVIAVQLQRADTAAYVELGFRVNQLGSSYVIDLSQFTLAGRHFVQLRNKISRARRADVTVAEEATHGPAGAALDAELSTVDSQWLAAKGRMTHELAFLIGERGGPASELRRLFVARQEGRVIAYLSFSPVYGTAAGWLHDLSRRVPDAPPGVMELALVTAIDRFREEAVGWLHFGFTPFTGLDPEHELAEAGSPAVGRAVALLAQHGRHIYPAVDQVAYKLKWRPHITQPDYIAFQGRPGVRSVWHLLRLIHAI